MSTNQLRTVQSCAHRQAECNPMLLDCKLHSMVSYGLENMATDTVQRTEYSGY